MYQNRTLPKLLMAALLVFCSFMISTKSFGQTFELMGKVGAGGQSFQFLSASTQTSSSKVAFFEHPNNLVEYDSITKKFTRRQIPYFVQTPQQPVRYPLDMAYLDGKYVFLVNEHPYGTGQYFLVTVDKNLKTVVNIPLTTNVPRVNSIAAVSGTSIRCITSQGLCQVNVVTGQSRVLTANLPTGITKYIRSDDTDYATTSTAIYRLKPSTQPKLILESTNNILAAIISDNSLMYVNDNLDLVKVKNGIQAVVPYPSRKSIDFGLTVATLNPAKIFRLANGVILGQDSGSVVTFDSNYNFINRYGAIGTCFFNENTKNAVSELGTTAVGRAGFVSITDRLGQNKDVLIKSLYNLDAIPKAITFVSEQYVLVAYNDVEPIQHTGIILIDVNQGAAIRQQELSIESIGDIEFNKNIYFSANGCLWTVDLFLMSPATPLPNITANFDLSVQDDYLYIYQGLAGIIKLSQSNEVVQTGIQSTLRKQFEYWIPFEWMYLQVLPDESLIVEYLGWVPPNADYMTPEGWPRYPDPIFLPQSMVSYMGNGKKSYFISGGGWDVNEVYRYTPRTN